MRHRTLLGVFSVLSSSIPQSLALTVNPRDTKRYKTKAFLPSSRVSIDPYPRLVEQPRAKLGPHILNRAIKMNPYTSAEGVGSSICVPCALCKDKREGSIPSRFTEVQHFSLQAACIREFKCTHTGARVFVCNVPSPVCNLYITFKTETHTDEGLPHTLEHLVFLGSKHYPYKVKCRRLNP